MSSQSVGQFVRAVPRYGPPVWLTLDGARIEACRGDTLITVMLTHGRLLRRVEFDDSPRAGFCLMGACQDCWVWIGTDRRVRACTTLAVAGVSVWTSLPSANAPR